MISQDFRSLLSKDLVSDIMGILNKGEGGSAYLVGGCLRNFLLNVPVKDIDIATSYLPDEVTNLLQSKGIKTIPTGIDHGTVTALGSSGHTVEITTLRRDVETDGRRAVVAFTKDIAEDARRRDFTLNALYLDNNGNLFDPTECGVDDIERRVLHFIGNAYDRIKEDALRILRFYRFGSVYSLDLPLSERNAVSQNINLLNNLSKERVTSEFFKMFSGENIVDILCIMEEDNIGKYLKTPEVNKEKLQRLHTNVSNIRNDQYLKLIWLWCFLNGLDYKDEVNDPHAFCLSNNEQKFYWHIGDVLADLSAQDKKLYKKLAYKYGKDLLMAALAIESARSEERYEIDALQKWSIPSFPLTGGDLLNLGLEQGPQIGRVLTNVEEWWIENNFSPTRQECLEKAEKQLN